MKRAALLGFSALLLLAGAVVVLPTFLDWNRYSGSISRVLANATGRDISMGNLSFHLLPQPTLRAADVVVANVEGGTSPEFARLQALDIRFAFLPLLTGNVRIESIGLVAPRVNLEALAEGSNNWTFGGGEDDESSSVRIDHLSVEGGMIDYVTSEGIHYQLTDINADLTARRLTGPMEGRASFRYEGVPLEAEVEAGDFANEARAAPLTVVLRLPAASAELRLSGSMRRQDTSLNGMLNVSGTSLHALSREISRIPGMQRLPALPQAPYTFSASLSGDSGNVVLSDLTLTADGEELSGNAAFLLGDTPSGELHLSASRFNLDKLIARLPERTPAENPEDREFSLPDGMRVTLDLGVSAVDYRGGIMRQVRLAARLEDGSLMIAPAAALMPGASDISLTGRLGEAGGEPVFAGQITANAGNARAFLTWAGMDVSHVPEGQLGQFSLSAPLALEGAHLRFAGLDASLDRSRLTGNVEATLGEMPDVRADVVLDRLDLDAYLQPVEGERKPVSLAMLTRFTGEVEAHIARLAHDGRMANDVAARAALDGKALTIRKLDVGQIGGATLSGTGTVTNLAGDPKADISLSARGDDAGRFLAALGYEREGEPAALGPFDLQATYKGTMETGEATAEGKVGATELTLNAALRSMRSQPGAAISIDLSNPSLADLARQVGRPLGFPEEGELPVTLVASLDGSSIQGTLEGRAMLGSGEVSITGRYAEAAAGRTYRFDITGAQDDPVPLMRALGLAYEPAGPLNGASLTATLTGEPGLTRLENLRLTLGDVRLEGMAAIDDTGERPMVTAQLEGGDIDLNAFLPPSETGVAQVRALQGQSAAAKAHARWSREPLDWSVVRDNDAEIRVTAKSLTYGPYDFEGPSLLVTARDGIMKVEPLAAGLFDGTATVRLTADVRQAPKLDIETEFKDVAVTQLSSAAMGNHFATGRLRMTGRFMAAGDSQYDIVRSLNGTAQVVARDGVIQHVDLKALTARLKALRTMNDFLDTARSALSGGQTPYNQVSGEIVVEDGVAATRNVTSDIEAAEADLTASADLPNWTIDAVASFSLTELPGSPPLTLTLSGPIDSPKRELGTRKLQNYFVSRIGAAALKEAIGRQEGGLGELLGGRTQPAPESSSPALQQQDGAAGRIN